MAGCLRHAAAGQHGRLQSLVHPARRPERLGQAPGLQRTLRARGLGADVGAPARPAPAEVGVDEAIGTAHQPHQLALGATLPASQTGTMRRMPHVSVDGGSGSAAAAAGATATGAGAARAPRPT